MNINKSDEYEQTAAVYQCLEIARLNEILKEQGIESTEARQAICKKYFFSSGSFLDSGWFKSEGKTFWPEMGFAERELDAVEGLGEIETLHLADYFSYHEYAGGDIYWYFTEHNEDVS